MYERCFTSSAHFPETLFVHRSLIVWIRNKVSTVDHQLGMFAESDSSNPQSTRRNSVERWLVWLRISNRIEHKSLHDQTIGVCTKCVLWCIYESPELRACPQVCTLWHWITVSHSSYHTWLLRYAFTNAVSEFQIVVFRKNEKRLYNSWCSFVLVKLFELYVCF